MFLLSQTSVILPMSYSQSSQPGNKDEVDAVDGNDAKTSDAESEHEVDSENEDVKYSKV